VRFGFKVLTRLGGYPLALHLAQRANTVPFLAPLVDPFVVHLAAVVHPAESPYPKSVEDVTDRFLNRPSAGRIVRWLMSTTITPNQVTTVSCVLGLAAAAALSLGSWPTLIVGALLLQFSIVVDCADGQLARAKGLTSQWGEVFDHTSDDLTFLQVSFALGLTVWRSDLGSLEKLLLVTSGFVAALLLTASQYFYNEEYRTVAARGAGGGVREDGERVLAACQTQGRDWLGRLGRGLLRYYAFRLGLMHRGLTRLNPWRARLIEFRPVDTSGRRMYWELQAFPLWLWRLAGMSSVALLLVVACLLGMPLGFAWLLTVAGLPYFVWVLCLQRRADRLTFRAWTK
jgi:phosphatidylglycerophosphate synthase